MSNQKNDSEKIDLNDTIDALFMEMSAYSSDSPEYAQMVAQLDTLYRLRTVDSEIKQSNSISKETWVAVGANLLGIGMIVGYERAHVLVSKALPLIFKIR